MSGHLKLANLSAEYFWNEEMGVLFHCSSTHFELRQEPTGRAAVWLLARWRLLEGLMDSIIYLVGLVVVIMAILSFLGLR
jgi:hypothetical protein